MAAQGTVPALADVQVERDVECRMRDGTVLRADVYRPVAGGDRPVLLQRSPYDKQIAQSDLAYPHPAWYAARGYLVVAQDVRGRWRSDGDFYPFVHEADDGWDTIEWAARLPGCDGRVAMYGFSYSGATQLLAAAGRPPSLAGDLPRADGISDLRGLDVPRGRSPRRSSAHGRRTWPSAKRPGGVTTTHSRAWTPRCSTPRSTSGPIPPRFSISTAGWRTTIATGSLTPPMTTTGGAGRSTRTTAGWKSRRYISAASTTRSSPGRCATSWACGAAQAATRPAIGRSC